MTFKEAIRSEILKKYITFSGRATRSEFWYAFVFVAGIQWLVGFLLLTLAMTETQRLSEFEGAVAWFRIYGIYVVGLIVLTTTTPILAVTVRRFHDSGVSGWWLLGLAGFAIHPILGAVASVGVFYLLIVPGGEGGNKYGGDRLSTVDLSTFE